MTQTHITNSGNKSSRATMKFLYSYGGKILPRQIDGKLRYVGGHTRVLAASRSVTYADLILKFREACGFTADLKCKLPSEDLDVLVTITSDADLAAVVEEYDQVSPGAKIRAVLCSAKSLKTISPVPSFESLVDFPASKSPPYPVFPDSAVRKATPQCQAVDFAPQYPFPGYCRGNPPPRFPELPIPFLNDFARQFLYSQ